MEIAEMNEDHVTEVIQKHDARALKKLYLEF